MKNIKQILASSMALALLSTTLPHSAASGFEDVSQTDWYYTVVTEMADQGFVSGTSSTSFSPNDSLTYAQFSVMISNGFYGNSIPSGTDQWWEAFMTACHNRGAYQGTAAENTAQWTSLSGSEISRFEMAMMISNLMLEQQIPMLSDSEISETLAGLNDTIPSEYETAVAMAYHYGFLNGKDGGIFDGVASLLRSEAAAVLSTLVKSDLISVEQAVTTTETAPNYENATEISLSDGGITVDGGAISSDASQAVYVSNDILFYVDSEDFTYGAASAENMHSQAEADAHTVVNITKAGTYRLSGTLSLGQIAINLGEDASTDPSAVVTILLDNANVTCEVAPALIFYSVYEGCSATLDNPTRVVNTASTGANVVILDDSVNYFTGSHVARIYKPESVVLSADGSSVEEYKTFYKYDGAFYSKMSMNVNAGTKGNGILNIYADNEGLDSELHLTINGGIINIDSGNDGINTNEDNISVTTINGGQLNIFVHGQTGEGDGIDSNGWIVINGGSIFAQACTLQGSMGAGWMGDAGIDSDLGIHIDGGTIFATGHMLDDIAESQQTFAVFIINESLPSGTYQVKNPSGSVVAEQTVTNSFTYLIVSYDGMVVGDYTLWNGDQLVSTATARTDALSDHGMNQGGMNQGGMNQGGMNQGGMNQGGMEMPEGMMPDMMMPDGMMNGMMPQGM